MSTVEVDVSIEERLVTVDRGPPSKSAKYKLLLTFGLACGWVRYESYTYASACVLRPLALATQRLAV